MILTVSLCSMAALTLCVTLYALYERREVERQKRDYARLEDGLRDAHSEIQRLFRRLGEAQENAGKLEHENIVLSGENERLRDQIEQAATNKKQLCEEIEKLLDENREQADKLSEIGNIFSYAGDETGQVELND